MTRAYIWIIQLLCMFQKVVADDSYKDIVKLRQQLLKSYDKQINPLAFNERHGIKKRISITVSLRRANDFDEVKGQLSATVFISINWQDFSLTWKDEPLYKDIHLVQFSSTEIWLPNIILENAMDNDAMFITDQSQGFMLTGTPNGVINLSSTRVLTSRCRPNLKYFPFDHHVCDFSFLFMDAYGPWTNVTYDVNIPSATDDIMEPTDQWYVKQRYPQLVAIQQGSHIKVAKFPFFLKRKYVFVVTNLIIPTYVLVILNVIVFFISPGSGERISFSTTVLLALSVYMSIVTTYIPKHTDPLPLLNYFFLMKFIYSTSITLSTIFTGYVAENKKYYRKLCKGMNSISMFCRLRKQRLKQLFITVETDMDSDETRCKFNRKEAMEKYEDTNISSIQIYNALDRFFLTFFLIVAIFETIIAFIIYN